MEWVLDNTLPLRRIRQLEEMGLTRYERGYSALWDCEKWRFKRDKDRVLVNKIFGRDRQGGLVELDELNDIGMNE
jgi:hypothetical protein